jgi:hypothetical protein
MVLDLEERVAAAVKKLKERGLVSPYLRFLVVASISPLRWIQGEPPPHEEVSDDGARARKIQCSTRSNLKIWRGQQDHQTKKLRRLYTGLA